MNNTNVETVSTPADKAKLAAAVLLVVAAVAAFYLIKQDLWLRVGALLGLLAAAAAVREAWPADRVATYPPRVASWWLCG